MIMEQITLPPHSIQVLSHSGLSFKTFGPFILSADKVYLAVCQLNSIQAS